MINSYYSDNKIPQNLLLWQILLVILSLFCLADIYLWSEFMPILIPGLISIICGIICIMMTLKNKYIFLFIINIVLSAALILQLLLYI
jgi:hypothetical protein